MTVLLWLIILLLAVIVALLIFVIKRDRNFGKEFGEAMLAMWTSAKDGRLTAEEKAWIKKEWGDIGWKAAFKEVTKFLK